MLETKLKYYVFTYCSCQISRLFIITFFKIKIDDEDDVMFWLEIVQLTIIVFLTTKKTYHNCFIYLFFITI